MSFLHFAFATDAFADAAETRARNVNNLEGHALAAWLQAQFRAAAIDASDIWPEDHGWDFTIAHQGAKYTCACAREADGPGPAEAQITLHKSRSLLDRLLGRNRLDAADPIAGALRTALHGQTALTESAAA